MTTAVDALLVLFEALEPDERGVAYERLCAAQAVHEAGNDSELQRMLVSLQLVAQAAGRMPPTITDYRQLAPELAEEGVVSFARLYAFFGKSWPRATEALGLVQTNTARRIDARFRSRRVGKVWRYSEAALGQALDACSAYYARQTGVPCERVAPLVSEFDHWRQRELELAQARGEDLHLPSASPYRRLWGSWEDALLHFGFSVEQLAGRLEGRRGASWNAGTHAPLPDGLPVATLAAAPVAELDDQTAAALRVTYEALPRRSRYVLTVRLGLGVEVQALREAAAPLGVHLSRIAQLQSEALIELTRAAFAGTDGHEAQVAGALQAMVADVDRGAGS